MNKSGVQELSFFSIIIPTYNRPGKLADCLESLARLDYPHDKFEVIVIDDGSDTPLQPVVGGFLNQINVTLLTQPHAGPADARNAGAEKAKGEFLVFTDDDCVPASNWLQNLAARFAILPDHAIGGRTLNAFPDNLYSAASQSIINYLYSYYNANPLQARFFTSNNLALPTKYFHTVGGFNTTFPQAAGEDREFCKRWLHHGYRMIHAPEVLVYHAHALTFRAFCQQHFNYGRGAFRFRQTQAQRGLERNKLEPLPFYVNLLRYPFAEAWGQRAMFILILFLVSQVATGIGFFHEGVD